MIYDEKQPQDSALESYAKGYFEDSDQMELLIADENELEAFSHLVSQISEVVTINSIDIQSLKSAGESIKDFVVKRIISIKSDNDLIQRAYDSLGNYALWSFELPNSEDKIAFRDCILFTNVMKELLNRKGIKATMVYQTGRLHPYLYVTNEDRLIRYHTTGTGDPIVEPTNENNLLGLLNHSLQTAVEQVYLFDENEFEFIRKLNSDGYVFGDEVSCLSMRHDDLIRLGAKIRASAKYSIEHGLHSNEVANNLIWIATELQRNHLRMNKTGVYPNAVLMIKGLQTANIYIALNMLSKTKA